MATNYPDALDTSTELPSNRTDATPSATNHAEDHNDLAAAVVAIEAELGTNPAGAAATVKARLDAVESGQVWEGAEDGFVLAIVDGVPTWVEGEVTPDPDPEPPFGSDTPAGVGLDDYPSVLSVTAIGDDLLIRDAADPTNNFSGVPYSKFSDGDGPKRVFNSVGLLVEQRQLFRTQPKLTTIAMPDGLGTLTPGVGIVNSGLAYDGTHLWVGNGASGTEASPGADNCSVVKMTLDGVKLAEYGMGAIFGNPTSVQGIGYDTSDDTLWIAQVLAGQVRHMTTTGVNVGDGFALANVNGLTYDATRDRLWCLVADQLTRRTKAGVVEATLDLDPEYWDHLHYDAERDYIWITQADNGIAGKLFAFDAATLTQVGFATVPDVTAIEGMTIIDGDFYVNHDGGYHTAAVIAENEIQVYPAVKGSGLIAWPIDHDPTAANVTLGYRVEPAFTQLVGYPRNFDNVIWVKSNLTVDLNTTVSPTGEMDADTFTAAVGTGTRYLTRSVTGAAVPYVTAVIAKMGTHRYLWFGDRGDTGGVRSATFDLQGAGAVVGASRDTGHIRALGNGWFRCERRGTRSSANNQGIDIGFGQAAHTQDRPSGTFAGTETLLVLAAESGAANLATSPVITLTTPPARAADTPALALSEANWGAANTIVVKARTARASVVQVVAQVDDGTANERIRIERDASNVLRCIVTDGGVEQANLSLGAVADNTDLKLALRAAAGDFAASLNGGAVVTDAAGTLPTPTTLRLGNSSTGEQWSSTVLSLVAIPQALPNATLQALAT